MPTSQWLVLIAFVYVGLLFAIAWWADRHRSAWPSWQPLIFSLSLAVYCSSWTFFGAVGRAVHDGWSYLAIYAGPILVFVLAWPFLRRLSVVVSRNRVTSIADFIGSRFGKSQLLAALVTALAVIGTLPYIALQLKAIAQAWMSAQTMWGAPVESSQGYSSFFAALILVVFTIAFGTRVAEERHRNKGLMTAIAVESVIKLLAFVLVGAFSLWVLWSRSQQGLAIEVGALREAPEPIGFTTQMVLAAAAIVCLPRQFHVMNVEHHNRRGLRMARWLFPLYLLLFCVFIVPITLLGQSVFPQNVSDADMFVVSLPAAYGHEPLAVIAVLGGLSAATGMVIIACLTLSIMVCNEWMVPLWQRFRRESSINAAWLQRVRRGAILAVLLTAWLLERQLTAQGGLASLGLLSFAAAAQLMPAVVAAVYWRRAHGRGVLAGLVVGGSLWFYCLLLPALLPDGHPLLVAGPLSVSWLAPEHLFGIAFADPLSHGVFWSLSANTLALIVVSSASRFRAIDLRQARRYTQLSWHHGVQRGDLDTVNVEAWQLRRLLAPLLGEARLHTLWQRFERRLGHRLLHSDLMPRFAVKEAEEALASIVGAVSAHRTIELLRRKKPLQLEEFVGLLGNTSRDIQFSQDLLQVTLETVPQGISVVDAELNLVAWNQRYCELFDFPERLLYVGCPIARVYQYNAERGYLRDASNDVDAAIGKRLKLLQDATPYRLERALPNGRVIEICGIPMARGGYVTTYTDISDLRQMLDELETAKNQLEQRVADRTASLAAANHSLEEENRTRARIERELQSVYNSKSRFLATASHDLLQPINAARLFTAALSSRVANTPLETDVSHIDNALSGAESLITSLREIARLDSGKLQIHRENFAVQPLLEAVLKEFGAEVARSDVSLRSVPCSLWVNSDPQLLRRMLQNLLGNALRYTRRGKVLVGCRRRGTVLQIQVWDNGPGIAEHDRERIFAEFERGANAADEGHEAGLGLGLSIVQRIGSLLGHEVSVASTLGAGSVFSITVPVVPAAVKPLPETDDPLQSDLAGMRVLCIDNEAAIRAGMLALLGEWQCDVVSAASLGDALSRWKERPVPDVVLVDYHLDNGETGVEVLQALSYHWGQTLSAVVISADNSDELRHSVTEAGYRFLPKPVKPAALRGLMRTLFTRHASMSG